ncbi:hypothetical protein D3C80_2143610 [compost metagenome]
MGVELALLEQCGGGHRVLDHAKLDARQLGLGPEEVLIDLPGNEAIIEIHLDQLERA